MARKSVRGRNKNIRTDTRAALRTFTNKVTSGVGHVTASRSQLCRALLPDLRLPRRARGAVAGSSPRFTIFNVRSLLNDNEIYGSKSEESL